MSFEICPRVDDAASYVLRAMPDGEWEQYADHASQCTVCTAKIAELGFVSDALLNAVPQLSAPPEIRSRVMAVVHAESELLLAAGPMADRPIQRESDAPLQPAAPAALAGRRARDVAARARDRRRCAARRHRRRGAVAADDRLRQRARRRVVLRCASPATTPSSSSPGLAAPPEGRIYQVWLDRGDGAPIRSRPRRCSPCATAARRSTCPAICSGVKQVLVTDEPLGGSETPTRNPVIAASIA